MKILKPREEVIYGSSAIPPSEYIPNQTEKLRTINGESAYYTFLGWKDDYSSIIEDTLIDSLWVKSPILKIYDCSGGEIFNNHVPYGSNFELPIIEENFNFKFLNWDNNIYINNNILYNIVLDITLTAECLEKHQITIFNCNGEIESQIFDIYADSDYLATLQKLSDYEYLIICPPKKVIVTYITDLGDIYAREELDAGEIAPSLTPSITYSCLAYDHLDGYDFSPLTEDITITAVYIPTKYNLTILYLDTNHEEIRSSETITDLCLGTSYTITAPDIPNYEFVSWSDGFPYKENEINILGETSVIATFKKCEYNLTFVNTDGTIRDRQVVAHGVTPIFPVLTPDSCETNLSWQENGVDASPKAVTEDHIYKAVASKKTITITKNLCGGNTSTETITCGTRYNPAGSWILNGDPYTAQELTLDTILTQADCSITIKFDDGGNIQSFDIPRNSKLNTTPTTSRPNKTFLGWFRGDEQFSILTVFTTNTTFYARYKSQTCNVTYKINNEEVRKLTVEANALFKLYYQEDQVITWHTDSSLHNPITGDYYSTPTDLILYGKIILKSYTLTINQCNGDTLVRHLAEGTVLTGTESYFQLNTLTATYSYNIRFPYTIKSDVTINETCKTLNCSYVVNYLDTQGNTIGYSQTGIAAWGSSKTFTALDIEGYESPSLTELTVLFTPESTYYTGGKFVINFVYTKNCVVTFTACSDVTWDNGNTISVKAGTVLRRSHIPAYTINPNTCIESVSLLNNITITEDTTVALSCTDKGNVRIYFDYVDPESGDTITYHYEDIPCGDTLQDHVSAPDCYLIDGYNVVNLTSIDESIGIDWYSHNYTDSDHIICTYIELPKELVTITYKINGNIYREVTIDKGTSHTVIALPSKSSLFPSDYLCRVAPSTWKEGSTSVSVSSELANVTTNRTFTATYSLKEYTVTYKYKLGASGTATNWSPAKTDTFNCTPDSTDPVNIIAFPEIEGYEPPVFWKNGADDIMPNTSLYFSEDVTLIATYTKSAAPTYTVTFNDWDGTTLKTLTVESGNNAAPPAEPTRECYTFDGWDSSYTNITSDKTITAQYTQNTYTVTYQIKTGASWEEVYTDEEYLKNILCGRTHHVLSFPTVDGYAAPSVWTYKINGTNTTASPGDWKDLKVDTTFLAEYTSTRSYKWTRPINTPDGNTVYLTLQDLVNNVEYRIEDLLHQCLLHTEITSATDGRTRTLLDWELNTLYDDTTITYDYPYQSCSGLGNRLRRGHYAIYQSGMLNGIPFLWYTIETRGKEVLTEMFNLLKKNGSLWTSVLSYDIGILPSHEFPSDELLSEYSKFGQYGDGDSYGSADIRQTYTNPAGNSAYRLIEAPPTPLDYIWVRPGGDLNGTHGTTTNANEMGKCIRGKFAAISKQKLLNIILKFLSTLNVSNTDITNASVLLNE